jgi:hypothetical protein
MDMGELTRFQVEIEQAQMNQIERLQLVCGFRTKRELMNNALTLFLWMVRELITGSTILSVNEQSGSRKELSMPFFDHVRDSDHAEHFRRAEATTAPR